MVVLATASVFRLARLDNRVMHCDEAGQAIKLGRLLEDGRYVYDPHEYHGPSLNYLTLPITYLASARELTDVSEIHLRLVPAVCGILLVALVWLLRAELGVGAALCAAALTAVSAAMVFYSRYYIQEMLLVCFTFGAVVAVWRYARSVVESNSSNRQGSRWTFREVIWLVSLGCCIGMMHASKETCIIPLFAIAIAAGVTMNSLGLRGHGKRVFLGGLLAILVAATVSASFYSSFGANPHGVMDSITTYSHYVGRATGQGSAGRHEQSMSFYFRVLFWWRRGTGPIWTEASIAILSLVGLAAGVFRKGVAPEHIPITRFLSVFSIVMFAVYSVLPYKTPWCAIGPLHGAILLAGIGMVVLIRIAPTRTLKCGAIALLAVAVGHLAWQAWRAGFVAYQDMDNPYVYAHATDDVPALADRVKRLASAQSNPAEFHIQVICPDDDYWPLPWYLRGAPNVGWSSALPDGPAAPVIIISPEIEAALIKKLYEEPPPGQRYLYVPLEPAEGSRDWQLRPNVPLQIYVRLKEANSSR